MSGREDTLQRDNNLNANSLSTTTTPLRLMGIRNLGFYVVASSGNSGSHDNHIATLQVSPNKAGVPNSKWFNVSTRTIQGEGKIISIPVVALRARVKITTVEGSSSTVDVILVGK